MLRCNPTVQIRAYKHSRKPNGEISGVDFNEIIKALDLAYYAEYMDYVILQLVMDTGMRIGETLNLKNDYMLIEKRRYLYQLKL